PLKIKSKHMIHWFLHFGNAVRSWNHYTMCIPLKIESRHMIHWFLLLGNAVGSWNHYTTALMRFQFKEQNFDTISFHLL
ncbi:MAG: hypothetical protein KH941_01490, partial [Clostridiales bacterium]|nr:hypothetical protein [Clostridiales bacterium]